MSFDDSWILNLLEAPLAPSVRICNALEYLPAQIPLSSRIQQELLTALVAAPAGADSDPSIDAVLLSPMVLRRNESQKRAI